MPDIDEVIANIRSLGQQIEERNGIPMFIHPVGLSVKDMEDMIHGCGWNRSWGYVGTAKADKKQRK